MTREEWLEPKDWEEPDYMYDDEEEEYFSWWGKTIERSANKSQNESD